MNDTPQTTIEIWNELSETERRRMTGEARQELRDADGEPVEDGVLEPDGVAVGEGVPDADGEPVEDGVADPDGVLLSPAAAFISGTTLKVDGAGSLYRLQGYEIAEHAPRPAPEAQARESAHTTPTAVCVEGERHCWCV